MTRKEENLQRLDELSELENGWISKSDMSGTKIHDKVIDFTRDLINKLEDETSIYLFPIPSEPYGGVQIETDEISDLGSL